jgi:hypothetical protein
MKAAEVRIDLISYCPPECPAEAEVVCEVLAQQIKEEYRFGSIAVEM